MKNKKYLIAIIAGVVLLLLIIICALASCSNSKKRKALEEVESKWPDLASYDIPKVNIGTGIDVTDESNTYDYGLNYKITLEGVTEEDVNEYCKQFSDGWTKSKVGTETILVKADSKSNYAVDIKYDENNQKAVVTITSLDY